MLVWFPNLGKENVMVTSTARLVFKVRLSIENANRHVDKNTGCAIVKKTFIKIFGNKCQSITVM